ncbi:MAG: hypothetical protein Q9193_004988 [Seirophora villosa]
MPSINLVRHAQITELSERWTRQPGRQFDLAIIVLGAVNVAAAFLMILVIGYDARGLAKMRTRALPRSRLGSRLNVHPAEILPLIISVAIIVQGTVFISVQSTSKDVMMEDCRVMAQVIWPALWIVPFTMLTRWNIRVSILAILLMALITWIPSYVSPTQGSCLASLVWWTDDFTKIGLVISSGLLFTFLFCAGVIAIQLIRTIKVCREQRIAATRIVYYLIISALIMVLIIPFFARTTMRIQAIATSHVAEVALNVLGIVHLALHFFLRSNADSTAIRRMETIWTRNQRLRLFGPSDLEMTMHITSPVLLDKGDARRFDDDNYKLRKDFHRPSRMQKCSSQPVVPESAEITHLKDFTVETKAEFLTPVQSPPQVFLSPCTPRKAYNYSIFPTFGSAMLRNSMSTTFSQGSEEALEPPKPILPVSHKREFSEQSSATLHIGCRLSNLDDVQRQSQSPSSFRLPLYGAHRSGYDSPLVSPLSSGPKIPGRLPQDTVLLPNQNKRNSQEKAARHSRSENRVPDWHGRRRSRSRSEYRRMTMKALPPDPPVGKNPQPPAYDSPRQL